MVIPSSAKVFTEDGSNLTPSELYELTNSTKSIDQNESVIFYYDSVCGSCIPAQEYIETYASGHPSSMITMVDLSTEPGNEDMLNRKYRAYNQEFLNVPVVFIGPVGLEGSDEIINGFEDVYNWYYRNRR